jgi:tetratricopeptide (TPR) repeat protein
MLGLTTPANGAASPDFNQVLRDSQPYIEQQRFDRAEAILKRGYEAYVKAGKADDIGALELRNNLAAVYYFSGKVDKAIVEFDAVRMIRERTLGLHHPHTRGAYQSLVRIYLDQKDSKKAENLLQSFAAKTQADTSPNYPDLFWALDWIKDIQKDDGRFQDALETSARLREACLKRNPDPSDAEYLQYVLNASALYAILGRLDEALVVINDALGKAKPSARNIEVLTQLRLNVSTIKIAQDDDASALDMLQVGLREIIKLGPIKGAPAAELMSGIGAIYVDRGEMRSAETYLDRALEVLDTALSGQTLPQNDRVYVNTYSLLGVVLAGDNQKDASLAALQFAFNQYSSLIPRPDRDWTLIGLRYVNALVQFGFLKQAASIISDMQRYFPADADDVEGNSVRILIGACAVNRAKGALVNARQQCELARRKQAGGAKLSLSEGLRLSGELALAYEQQKDLVQSRRISVEAIQGLVSKPESFVPKFLQADAGCRFGESAKEVCAPW